MKDRSYAFPDQGNVHSLQPKKQFQMGGRVVTVSLTRTVLSIDPEGIDHEQT